MSKDWPVNILNGQLCPATSLVSLSELFGLKSSTLFGILFVYGRVGGTYGGGPEELGYRRGLSQLTPDNFASDKRVAGFHRNESGCRVYGALNSGTPACRPAIQRST